MKLVSIEPPREFTVGSDGRIRLRHVANVELATNEQVTFISASGTEFDVVRKEWGYYATPSLNARLREKGLRGVLVRSGDVSRLYLLLVESGQEEAFLDYVHNEYMEVVAWVDSDNGIDRLLAGQPPAVTARSDEVQPPTCEFCHARQYRLIRSFDAPPPGETRFASLASGYQRSLWQCGGCGHVVNQTPFGLESLYLTEYVDATYGAKLSATFDSIMRLPSEKSDNHFRVERVISFFEKHNGQSTGTLLDVGSGLCVFGAAMDKRGWHVTVLDPDERAVAHARDVVGLSAIHGDFMSYSSSNQFDIVTLNKVLEHVRDPIGFLSRVRNFVVPGGFAYVEVPDAEGALQASPDREEFFVEHRGAFSTVSTAQLVRRSGFELVSLERQREPSGKYTLFAILRVPQS